MYFEMALLELGNEVQSLARSQIQDQKTLINNCSQSIYLNSKSLLKNEDRMISYIENEIPRLARKGLENESKLVTHIEQVVELLDPEEVLKRGFSITLHEGKPVSDPKVLEEETIIETLFSKGKLK